MKKWIIQERKSDGIINQILDNRQIEIGKRAAFLNPNFEIDLHNPHLLHDGEKAANRIIKAIKNKEKIGIFSDYDADGIPGAVIIYDALKKLGALDSFFYIPERVDGYGFSEKAINEMIKHNVKLIITIDSGITAKQEVEYAKKKNIDVIITDHHEIQKNQLPEAYAVINPKLSPEYPFQELCGAAVVYKLVELISYLYPEKISHNWLKWLLDMVAISTICDMVPLVDENRVLAKYGLIVLQKTRRLGLKKLYEIAGINPEKIDPYVVGFQIGPRINAGGRLQDSKIAFELLISEDENDAKKMALKINNLNVQRQKMLNDSLLMAIKKVSKDGLDKKKIIMVTDNTWEKGIVGLIAGKLTEKYYRPSIVLSKEEDNFTGSARSIDGLSLIDALTEVSDILTNFGGHKKAAGLTLPIKNAPLFYKKILQIAEEKLSDEDLLPKLNIDLIINPEEINEKNFNEIKKIEPFGLSNPKPIFVLENLFVSDINTVGEKQEHLKLKLSIKLNKELFTFSAIGFGLGKEKIKQGDIIDIAFHLERDDWATSKSNQVKLQLKIIDMKIMTKKK